MQNKTLNNQPDKGSYKKEEFPLPKERTFEEWTQDLEKINRQNMMDSNCLMVTAIQWNELKQIVEREVKWGREVKRVENL